MKQRRRVAALRADRVATPVSGVSAFFLLFLRLARPPQLPSLSAFKTSDACSKLTRSQRPLPSFEGAPYSHRFFARPPCPRPRFLFPISPLNLDLSLSSMAIIDLLDTRTVSSAPFNPTPTFTAPPRREFGVVEEEKGEEGRRDVGAGTLTSTALLNRLTTLTAPEQQPQPSPTPPFPSALLPRPRQSKQASSSPLVTLVRRTSLRCSTGCAGCARAERREGDRGG